MPPVWLASSPGPAQILSRSRGPGEEATVWLGIVDILHLSMLYTSLKVPKKLVSLTKRFDHTTVVTIAHQQTPIDAQMTN